MTFKYPLILLGALGFFLMAFTENATPVNEKYGIAEDTVYIIQLRKNTNPKVIQAAKGSLMKKYPDKTLLTQVQPPNYILCIGYFATAAEAEDFKIKNNLEKDFLGCTVLPFEKKKQ